MMSAILLFKKQVLNIGIEKVAKIAGIQKKTVKHHLIHEKPIIRKNTAKKYKLAGVCVPEELQHGEYVKGTPQEKQNTSICNWCKRKVFSLRQVNGWNVCPLCQKYEKKYSYNQYANVKTNRKANRIQG